MDDSRITNPSATARDLWRRVRRNGWHLGMMRAEFGWRAPGEEQARSFRKAIGREPGYTPAPAEAYEPENDPLETIVHGEWRRLSAAQFEEQVRWAEAFAAPFGAVMTRIGLERAR